MIGRFISEDTYLGRSSDPLSLNLYTYCYNNPVIFRDPSGHDATFGEKWNSLWNAGVFGSLKIDAANEDAFEISQEYAKNNGFISATDNEVDALRHFSWNYLSVKSGAAVDGVSSVATYHEIIRQEFVGKDDAGNSYHRVAISSLMDLVNNSIGRYQATLETNEDKTALEVFEKVKDFGLLISLQQTCEYFDIDEFMYIEAKYDDNGNRIQEASVIIKGDLSEDFNDIEIVNSSTVNALSD